MLTKRIAPCFVAASRFTKGLALNGRFAWPACNATVSLVDYNSIDYEALRFKLRPS